MAINKNHEFEELGGVKCAIVEKQVGAERAAFLEQLLSYNGYKVIIQPIAETKTPQPDIAEEAATPAVPLFTVGVTDVMFNPVNAIFGRLLRAPGGQVVTLAYWKQKEAVPKDETPYFENRFYS
ncbi:hypothetical protein [Sediminibacterium soli]|uniref:hypothetical protein n=1 Tax=Sediminibacterium soli TaxID=2698829 RepID=UPI0013794B84|nr:hypothetical protein [Sediminibacterium soli]NCI47198.1 hypothetical protein [Sediminibacterium soli]